MNNKIKLKTLKDFRRPKDEEAPYTGEWAMGVNETCDKLKKEAIKWAKEHGEQLDLYDWLHFFNITEEDLK